MNDRWLYAYLPQFDKDIAATLRWSEKQFGREASDRYSTLIKQAVRDILTDPDRPAAMARAELGSFDRVYHLSLSRTRVQGPQVKSPRHFILYRKQDDRIEFARLIHDSRDVSQTRRAKAPRSVDEKLKVANELAKQQERRTHREIER